MATIRCLDICTLIRAYSTLNEKENATSQNSNTDDQYFFKFILRQLLSIKVFNSKMLTNASKKDDPKNTQKLNNQYLKTVKRLQDSGNALARMQEPVDLWDITF